MNSEVVEKVRNAGVIGAGGAGFPTHVKLQADVKWVLANGASCEPLLMSDILLMEKYPSQVLEGLGAAMEAVGASRGVVCIKGKHRQAIERMRSALDQINRDDIELFELGDYYPAGDEHVLVYEVLGRPVPEAGLPLQVGAVVSNIESLYNIQNALKGIPVTDRYLTVTGEVERPLVVKVPLGSPALEVVSLAGRITVDDYRIVDGGPMMGRVLDDPNEPISKTTSGLIVLPADHNVVQGRVKDPETIRRITKIACCQCTLCTELCPRYLLGHNLHPHKIMRQLNGMSPLSLDIKKEALICSECGICEKFACPMMISPREVNVQIKKELMAEGIRWTPEEKELKISAFRKMRFVPTKRLVQRLQITKYDKHPDFYDNDFKPSRVKLPLGRHIGAPAWSVVKPGDYVVKGDLVGEIPEGALGARVHASIDGRVASVDDKAVVLER